MLKRVKMQNTLSGVQEYGVPNVFSPRDLVSRPNNMDETVLHTHCAADLCLCFRISHHAARIVFLYCDFFLFHFAYFDASNNGSYKVHSHGQKIHACK